MKRALAFAFALTACAGPVGTEAVFETASAPLDVRHIPWPNDALMGDDGRLQVAAPFPFDAANGDNIIQLGVSLSELDGFANSGSIFFPVSADITVDEGAVAKVVDLDEPGAPVLEFRLLYRADTQQLVAIAPFGTALAQHHAHGAWIERGVPGLHPSPDLQVALAGKGPTANRGAWPKLVKRLQDDVIRPIAATAFTTQTLTAWVPKVLSDLAAMPPKATPTRVFHAGAELQALFGGPAANMRPGKPPSGGVYHASVAMVVEGTYDVPHYLSATPGHLGLFDAQQSVKSIDHVPFLLAVPVAQSLANTPVVIFQHGINSDRTAVLLVANSFCARGFAVLGIDELWHGSRQPDNKDEVFNLSGQPGPDGIGDPVSAGAVQFFFDLRGDSAHGVASLDPRFMRDNFRQATVDLMQEVRLGMHGDFSAVAAADPALSSLTLDGSKLIYAGESFGSILGAQVLAVDPELRGAVLDVGGGGLLFDLVARSAQFAQLLQPFVAGAYDLAVDVNSPDTLPARAQMSLNLLQTIVEPGDGLSLAAARDPSKAVLFLEAYGDETVPNSANESLSAAWGATQVQLSQGTRETDVVVFPQARAPYAVQPLHALVELHPATHPMITQQQGQREYVPPSPPFVKLPAKESINNPIELVQGLAVAFAESFRLGLPSVPDGL